MQLLHLFIIPFLLVNAQFAVEEDFQKVTCASAIKLTNKSTGYKLHSHSVTYGSGSGQQSVTAFPEANDANSLWLVEAGSGLKCKRGEPVPCGSIIRLKHVNTRSYLHSHAHQSPLSRQQEVSCYDGQDSGDDWKVECDGQYWTRENVVQLAHQDTSAYLSSSDRYQFGQPIPGQLEVAAVKGSSKNTQWIAQEGIYFASI